MESTPSTYMPAESSLPFKKTIVIQKDQRGLRLDSFLERYFKDHNLPFSRSYIQKQIDTISVNGSVVKKNYRTKEADQILIDFPPVPPIRLEPEQVDFEVVFEDPYLIVVNKPAGLVVHPAKGHQTGTLVHGLLYRFQLQDSFNDTIRPGIVHRLDKDTAGLLLVAKDSKTRGLLEQMFKTHQIHKVYHAITRGVLKPQYRIKSMWEIDKPIGRHPHFRKKFTIRQDGKPSLSRCAVLKSNPPFHLIKVHLITGRTHQIRVHLASEGLPILGDPIYSKQSHQDVTKGMALYSKKIAFKHPITQEILRFATKPPAHIKRLLIETGLHTIKA